MCTACHSTDFLKPKYLLKDGNAIGSCVKKSRQFNNFPQNVTRPADMLGYMVRAVKHQYKAKFYDWEGVGDKDSSLQATLMFRYGLGVFGVKHRGGTTYRGGVGFTLDTADLCTRLQKL